MRNSEEMRAELSFVAGGVFWLFCTMEREKAR